MSDTAPQSLTPVFHGTLGAPLRMEADLPEPFASLRRRFLVALRDYAAGNTTKYVLGQHLATLRVTTDDGVVWTMGAATGTWYAKRRPGAPWEMADPRSGRTITPPAADPTRLTPPPLPAPSPASAPSSLPTEPAPNRASEDASEPDLPAELVGEEFFGEFPPPASEPSSTPTSDEDLPPELFG